MSAFNRLQYDSAANKDLWISLETWTHLFYLEQIFLFYCTYWTRYIWKSLRPQSSQILIKESSVNFTQFSSDLSLRFWQQDLSRAHFSESSQRGERGGGGEREGGGEAEEEAGGGKSGVSLLLLQAKAYTEQQQAEKTVLYCFRPAGKVSLPETQQQLSHTNAGDVPKPCSLRGLPKW